MAKHITRAEVFGHYITDNNCTIRAAAAHFTISKSTLHADVSHKLKKINYPLYLQTQKILQKNFNEKHIRGGEATRLKYHGVLKPTLAKHKKTATHFTYAIK